MTWDRKSMRGGTAASISSEDRLQRFPREASAWRRLLVDEPAPNSGFTEWLVRSPNLSKVCLEQTAMDLQRGQIVGAGSFARTHSAASAEGQRRGWGTFERSLGRVCAFGAAALLVIAILGIGVHARQDTQAPAFATRTGESRTIILADGSTMQLNTHSRVQVHYSGAARRIDLLEGEVLFSVVPNARRPFRVKVGSLAVRALGTTFAVRRDRGKLETLAVEGSVQVARDNRLLPFILPSNDIGAPLVAGERLTVGHGVLREHLALTTLERALQWTQGKLRFEDEPLEDIIQELNRYTIHRIEIRDPALRSVRAGGTYRIDDADGYGRALERYFGSTRIARD
jgi:transmembrane sensor